MKDISSPGASITIPAPSGVMPFIGLICGLGGGPIFGISGLGILLFLLNASVIRLVREPISLAVSRISSARVASGKNCGRSGGGFCGNGGSGNFSN